MNSLFSSFWFLWADQVQAVAQMVAMAIAAGPADEAERDGKPIKKHGNIAVVNTVGPMIKNAGYMTRWGFAGIRDTQSALIAAEQDSEVQQILWYMDTPGGTVDGLQELADTVAAINKQKPITVQVDGMLASAGYYVASQASAIYAASSDLVGSIGTRTVLMDWSKFYEEAGIKVIPVDTGEHKSAGLRGTEITEAQIAEFQRIVDGYNEMFLSAVETGRNMPRKNLEKVADGRVFFARESVELGLIDGVQSMNQTLAALLAAQPVKTRSNRAARATLARLKTL